MKENLGDYFEEFEFVCDNCNTVTKMTRYPEAENIKWRYPKTICESCGEEIKVFKM